MDEEDNITVESLDDDILEGALEAEAALDTPEEIADAAAVEATAPDETATAGDGGELEDEPDADTETAGDGGELEDEPGEPETESAGGEVVPDSGPDFNTLSEAIADLTVVVCNIMDTVEGIRNALPDIVTSGTIIETGGGDAVDDEPREYTAEELLNLEELDFL